MKAKIKKNVIKVLEIILELMIWIGLIDLVGLLLIGWILNTGAYLTALIAGMIMLLIPAFYVLIWCEHNERKERK